MPPYLPTLPSSKRLLPSLVLFLFTLLNILSLTGASPPSEQDASPQEPNGDDAPKRRRRKLSLVANVMEDLGLDDQQKLIVALVFGGLIILPRFFGFDTRPRSRYGDVMHRQKVAEVKRKKAAAARDKKDKAKAKVQKKTK
ncbi:hypothetical protein TrRE_jg9409 [Triparma retinervis]|uniref:Transmembrane protein n=1 Tax=Triparma retinervis TaxID=2557542 RepID=A0A9W7DYY5_9STRA|nr:hypothetical protein TrRE_jg9409 [Triparma retinervis]